MEIYWPKLSKQLNVDQVCDTLLAATQKGMEEMYTVGNYSGYATETFKDDISICIPLGERFPEVLLTEREAHCALLMILGFTSRQSAEKMYLSSRTVEHYIINLKKKLKLKKRSDIIMTLLNSDFIRNVKEML